MSEKPFDGRATSMIGPAVALAAVTPDDAVELPQGCARGLYVGTAGSLTVMDLGGGIVTLESLEGQYHPIMVRKVLATGTTAGAIVALY